MKNFLYYIGLIVILGCNGCNETNQPITMDFYKVYDSNVEDIPDLLKTVSAGNIYFGHQSVGNNILGGIDYWSEFSEVPIEVIETRDFTEVSSSSFIHFRIGENLYPYKKIDDFVNIVPNIPNDSNAVAFFKLCYVDILDTTDVEPLFDYYKEHMLLLKDSHPDVNIILVTAPFTTIQKGAKALAKRVLFMPVSGEVENTKRHAFNERVINELSSDFSIFDLGRVETTLPDGSRNTYKYKGSTYPALPDSYASDHGHLNDFGSQVVAYNLISFLANELRRKDNP